MASQTGEASLISVLRSVFAWLLLAVIVLVMLALLALARIVPHRGAVRRFLSEEAAGLYARLSPLYRIRIEGREHLPSAGPYVVVANHESGLDFVCLMMLRIRARFVAASWLFRAPLFGWVMRACEHISVGRRDAGEGALAGAEAALGAGTNVAIFPEGAYSPGDLHDFRSGAFVVAQRAGVPIVPVRLRGTGAAWRPGTWIVEGRNAIHVCVLPRIAGDEVRSSTPDALAARVRAALASSD